MAVASLSFIHSGWFRATFRFVAALSIPALIVWFFYFSQQEANKQWEGYQTEVKNNPLSTGINVNNYELKEVDDFNNIKWQLVAKKGAISEDNKDVALVGVTMRYYDGPNVKMSICAPIGNVKQDTKYVKLLSQGGTRVKGEGDGGKSVFEAEVIELTKKNQFLASGGVIIEWSEVAKVTGNSATGTIDKTGIKDVKVTGGTHAIIVVK